MDNGLFSYVQYCHEFLDASSLYRLQSRHCLADDCDDALATILPRIPKEWATAFKARVRLREFVSHSGGCHAERVRRVNDLRSETALPNRMISKRVSPKDLPERLKRLRRSADWLNGSDHTLHEDSAGNLICKIAICPSDVDVGRFRSVASVLRYWQSLPRHGAVFPRVTAFDPMGLQDCQSAGYVHVIDVSSTDPVEFYVQMYGSKTLLNGACDLTGAYLKDLNVSIHSQSVLHEYNSVKILGIPKLHLVYAILSGEMRTYLRLIAPIATDGWHCDKLLVAVQYASS